MFIKRLEIANYGPILQLDIDFPFDDAAPMPVVFVGANGSGKTIMLSHIANSLLMAQSLAYPASRELPENKVYKVRSSHYINLGNEYSYARLEFDGEYTTRELCYQSVKKSAKELLPSALAGKTLEDLWAEIPVGHSNVFSAKAQTEAVQNEIAQSYRRQCALYFPSDRADAPAWLNPVVLDEGASEPKLEHFQGETGRVLVDDGSMRANRDWLIGVLFDKYAFGIRFLPMQLDETERGPVINVFGGYEGAADSLYDAVLTVLKIITGRNGTRFGIGGRHNRVVSLWDGDAETVPNIFQLSSGEMMLLDMSLSILRDFDWSEGRFERLSDVSGIVVVDEIDLHLHMRLQRTALPSLLKLFPNVQFVVTTHSPFFVLGMQEVFDDSGFVIRRMPEGDVILPEEFSEFDSAYIAIAESDRFARELQSAVESSTKSMLVVEGKTDIEYLTRSAALLSRTDTLARVQLHDGNGEGNMRNYWKGCNERMSMALGRRVLLLFDCDVRHDSTSIMEKGNLIRRVIPQCTEHPAPKGVENRFSRATLDRARAVNGAWIDTVGEHTTTVDGVENMIPETWTVPNDHKMALCGWLCEHGTPEDFCHFEEIFDLIDEALADATDETE